MLPLVQNGCPTAEADEFVLTSTYNFQLFRDDENAGEPRATILLQLSGDLHDSSKTVSHLAFTFTPHALGPGLVLVFAQHLSYRVCVALLCASLPVVVGRLASVFRSSLSVRREKNYGT